MPTVILHHGIMSQHTSLLVDSRPINEDENLEMLLPREWILSVFSCHRYKKSARLLWRLETSTLWNEEYQTMYGSLDQTTHPVFSLFLPFSFTPITIYWSTDHYTAGSASEIWPKPVVNTTNNNHMGHCIKSYLQIQETVFGWKVKVDLLQWS